MRYKIIRWTRQIRIWLGGGKDREVKHFMFTLPLITPEEVWEKLWPHDWGYNTMSHTYRGQIFTVRKVVPPQHQYHLRFYDNGDVTGHYETDPFIFALEHMDEVDLRPLTDAEIEEIKTILTGG